MENERQKRYSTDVLLAEFFAQDDLKALAVDAGALLECPLLVLDDTFHVTAHHRPLGFTDPLFQETVRQGQITYEAGAVISQSDALSAGKADYMKLDSSEYRRRFAPLISSGVRLGFLSDAYFQRGCLSVQDAPPDSARRGKADPARLYPAGAEAQNQIRHHRYTSLMSRPLRSTPSPRRKSTGSFTRSAPTKHPSSSATGSLPAGSAMKSSCWTTVRSFRPAAMMRSSKWKTACTIRSGRHRRSITSKKHNCRTPNTRRRTFPFGMCGAGFLLRFGGRTPYSRFLYSAPVDIRRKHGIMIDIIILDYLEMEDMQISCLIPVSPRCRSSTMPTDLLRRITRCCTRSAKQPGFRRWPWIF